MINTNTFKAEMTRLAHHFKTEFSEYDLSSFKEFLSEALDTQEFIAACNNARRDCKPNANFIPSCQWLIDSVLGTLEDRAKEQLQNLDRLSVVGRQAFEAVGGSWAYKNSESPEFFRKDFVSNYLTLAKKASPDELRMPLEAAKALKGSIPPKPINSEPQPYNMPLWEKLEILKCKRRVKRFKEAAEIEARAFGFKITEDCFYLGQNQDPNQLISSVTLDVAHLVSLFTKTGKTPVGIVSTQFEREVEF